MQVFSSSPPFDYKIKMGLNNHQQPGSSTPLDSGAPSSAAGRSEDCLYMGKKRQQGSFDVGLLASFLEAGFKNKGNKKLFGNRSGLVFLKKIGFDVIQSSVEKM